MIKVLLSIVVLASTAAQANDLLVKLASPISAKKTAALMANSGLKTDVLTDSWIRVQGNINSTSFERFAESSSVEYTQPNFKIRALENPNLAKLRDAYKGSPSKVLPFIGTDNPEIPGIPSAGSGNDPLFAKQWGMKDIGVEAAWNIHRGTSKIIVAVIDTGVDYTHEDLLPNMWRNSKEIPNNKVDDDGNGYIDDVVGWDFVSNDNKPYDLAATTVGELLNGGNPGHGTHCAGNVAAAGINGKGISGVAPQAQIMALRFLGNEGGTTADAVKAIKYAVDNGAKVLSNSWGSEGEDPEDGANNLALSEIITYAENKDVLFIAAAGNGHQGKGYNNDTDSRPGVPASYNNENIISVAALDASNKLGSFSNWGVKTVDIGAPGVKVYSTTVGSKYSDTVIDLLGATWDGTSMACPHVAGAAALYWSAHPEKNWKDVKAALLNSARRIPALDGKVYSNGKLNVEDLMKY
ncbi:MAG: protease [Bdellovibrionales bacterium RIFCSPHIGHO2_01_FULL_40_29]|nr:MAG: protease [Bdellovibrionales bacterium RIFCSPHIGHO2_01_FULL_40_29]OFZ33958.1 MAG: protease [Bdellovibrionales bacterium RIFCSPHIGHO2_02_FULL_40_15]